MFLLLLIYIGFLRLLYGSVADHLPGSDYVHLSEEFLPIISYLIWECFTVWLFARFCLMYATVKGFQFATLLCLNWRGRASASAFNTSWLQPNNFSWRALFFLVFDYYPESSDIIMKGSDVNLVSDISSSYITP